MEARATWRGGFTTRLDDGRGHEMVVDLPEDEGGRDLGTSGLELAVLSLAGCISTIFALVAARRRLRYEGLEVRLTAERPPGATTVQSVHGTVEVRSAAPEEEIATALRLTVRTCPVGVLFEQAHIPMDIALEVLPPIAVATLSV